MRISYENKSKYKKKFGLKFPQIVYMTFYGKKEDLLKSMLVVENIDNVK